MTECERVALIADTASKMRMFEESLACAYQKLVDGREFLSGEQLPSQLVGQALNVEGGVICRLLYSYVDGVPTTDLSSLIGVIVRKIEALFELANDAAKRAGQFAKSGMPFVKRFAIKPERVFRTEYLDGITSAVRTTAEARERLLNHLCAAFRNFLAWLRETMMLLQSRMQVDPMCPFRLTPYAQSVVEMVDRRLGLVVLKAQGKEGSIPFHILPTSEKVWEILRLLLEESDADGYVKLPKTYASNFHHTDRDNETIHDAYEALLRHIVPGKRTGYYRLEIAEKPRLSRDK